MTQQVLDQLEFPDGELDRTAAARDFARHEIDLQIADAQAERLGDPAPPQQRPDPREHLLERKRFDQVIVGPAVQAPHAILERIARGQNQHRCLVSPLAQRSEDLQAVAARQHEIEQDGVERFGVQTEKRTFARVLDRDVVAFTVESFPEGIGDLLFVLDDEDPRRHVSRGHPDRTAGCRHLKGEFSTPIVVLAGSGRPRVTRPRWARTRAVPLRPVGQYVDGRPDQKRRAGAGNRLHSR